MITWVSVEGQASCSDERYLWFNGAMKEAVIEDFVQKAIAASGQIKVEGMKCRERRIINLYVIQTYYLMELNWFIRD